MVQDQLWVNAEIGRLLSQAVPEVLCPQCFGLVPLSSRSGPTCALRPLHTPVRLATFQCHLDIAICGQFVITLLLLFPSLCVQLCIEFL